MDRSWASVIVESKMEMLWAANNSITAATRHMVFRVSSGISWKLFLF